MQLDLKINLDVYWSEAEIILSLSRKKHRFYIPLSRWPRFLNFPIDLTPVCKNGMFFEIFEENTWTITWRSLVKKKPSFFHKNEIEYYKLIIQLSLNTIFKKIQHAFNLWTEYIFFFWKMLSLKFRYQLQLFISLLVKCSIVTHLNSWAYPCQQ